MEDGHRIISHFGWLMLTILGPLSLVALGYAGFGDTVFPPIFENERHASRSLDSSCHILRACYSGARIASEVRIGRIGSSVEQL